MGNANGGSFAHEHSCREIGRTGTARREEPRHAARLCPRRADHARDARRGGGGAPRPGVRPRGRGGGAHRHPGQRPPPREGPRAARCGRGPLHQGQRQPRHLRGRGGRQHGVGEGRDGREVRRGRHHGPFQLRQDPLLPAAARGAHAAHGGHRPHVRRHRLHGEAARGAHCRGPSRHGARPRGGRRGLPHHPLRHQPPRDRDLQGDRAPHEHRQPRRVAAVWLDGTTTRCSRSATSTT